MKHWVIYIVLTAAVVLTGSLPFANHDVGKLVPVDVLAVSVWGEQVVLKTDVGDSGRGESWQEALENLKATAPGTVFLGTAGYLLLDDSAMELLPELLEQRSLNPGCALCRAPWGMDLEGAGKYLGAHEPEVNLQKLRGDRGLTLPVLREQDGRYLLVQPGN